MESLNADAITREEIATLEAEIAGDREVPTVGGIPLPGDADAGSPPYLDPKTTRLVLFHATTVISTASGWSFRLPAGASCASTVIAIRPRDADPALPPFISREFSSNIELRIGTVDELVDAYRIHLMASFAQLEGNESDSRAVLATAAAFANAPSGTLPALFGY